MLKLLRFPLYHSVSLLSRRHQAAGMGIIGMTTWPGVNILILANLGTNIYIFTCTDTLTRFPVTQIEWIEPSVSQHTSHKTKEKHMLPFPHYLHPSPAKGSLKMVRTPEFHLGTLSTTQRSSWSLQRMGELNVITKACQIHQKWGFGCSTRFLLLKIKSVIP